MCLTNMKFIFCTLALFAGACLGLSQATNGQEWWQFRGDNFGHVSEPGVPTTWGGFLQEPTWKIQLPGKGWSSPIVLGDRVWVTSSEETALDSASIANTLEGRPFNTEDLTAHASVVLLALEIDATNGKIVRRIDLMEYPSPSPVHRINSYASPTPVTDGERIYCHFGSLGTVALDASSGSILWKREINVEELTGSGSSPVLFQDLLILACDGADQQFLIALDKKTGETKWKVDRPTIEVSDDTKRRAFSTPIIVRDGDRTQLISMSAQWLISYNPMDGSEWWRARVGNGYSAVPTPVYDRNRVFISTGFTSPELVAVRTDGHGDVTQSHILWRSAHGAPDVASPIVVGDEVYCVSSKGIATCMDTATGKRHWQQRLEGSFSASPVYAPGRIYFTNSSGVTTVIKPGLQYEELARNELFGETYASLVVYKQNFLLRTNSLFYSLNAND